MRAKSSRLWRTTVAFTSLSRPLPASPRIASRFWKIWSVCSWIDPPESSFSPGRSASWPETKTRSPTRIACEYGAPWNGAGARSVRTPDFSATAGCLSPAGREGLRQRDAERLEDRVQYVLGFLALDQADVQREPGALCQLPQEPRREVGVQPGHSRVGEVDVGDDERASGDFERDVREGLVGRDDRGSVAAAGGEVDGGRERLAECAAGVADLLV